MQSYNKPNFEGNIPHIECELGLTSAKLRELEEFAN